MSLSVELLKDAGRWSSSQSKIIALDPDSFPTESVIPGPASQKLSRGRRSAESIIGLAGNAPVRISDAMADADLLAFVGGGYLRFGNVQEALKARIAHVEQLSEAVRRTDASIVLLPQSIGPLGWQRRSILNLLSRTDRVYLRDDRSVRELDGLPQTRRMPDLGVLAVGRSSLTGGGLASDRGRDVVFLLRSLRRPGSYEASIRQLLEMISEPKRGGVQSRAGTTNQDDAQTRAFGFEPEAAKTLFKEASTGLVISVRLHGAIEAILNGIPAIHLSYERKGWGAFSDLGLEEYVHSARSFNPKIVAQQVNSILSNPAKYFENVHRSHGRLNDMYQLLVSEIAHLGD